MNIYSEIKKIAEKNESIKRLGEKLYKKVDCDGLILEKAHFVTGCKEYKGHLYKDGQRLDRGGLVDNDYYYAQRIGYCDDYNGTLYFKTNVPGQFVAVPFEF